MITYNYSILRKIRVLFFLILVIIQSIFLYMLFQQSVEVNGDIVSYLEVINGNPFDLTFDFEPISFLIFKLIGIFPENSHFTILYLVSLICLIVSNYIIFKKTNNSISWIVFYGICIMPFACAINLRTGYGFLFLLLLGFRKITIFVLPLFHASLGAFLLAIRVRFSFWGLSSLIFFSIVLIYFLGNLITNKFSSYLLYYLQGQSLLGILMELVLISIFLFFFNKIYKLKNNYLLLRVCVALIVISFLFSPIAIISSRFISLIYFVLIVQRVYSLRKSAHVKSYLSLNNLMFGLMFIGLILFRVYRLSTMFGYFEMIQL